MLSLILIATVVCVFVYFFNKEITAKEFLITVLATNVVVVLTYSITYIPFHNDEYFASGRVVDTVYYPEWVETYQQSHTYCTGSGKTRSCHTYYTTEYDTHEAYWTANDSLNQEINITRPDHDVIKKDFGNHKITTQPYKCTHGGRYYSGDPNVYTYKNETNTYKYPTNMKIGWYNPLKNAGSLFDNKTDFKIPYPKELDKFSTNRFLTENKSTNFNKYDWDVLNTKVYSTSKANLILVSVKSISDFPKLESYWNKGNRNDIVICIVGKYSKPEYVKVFGWTETSKVKVDLEQLILDKGLVKEQFQNIINIVKQEYKQVDFKKYGYLNKKPSMWIIILCVLISGCTCGFLFYNFSENYESRENGNF